MAQTAVFSMHLWNYCSYLGVLLRYLDTDKVSISSVLSLQKSDLFPYTPKKNETKHRSSPSTQNLAELEKWGFKSDGSTNSSCLFSIATDLLTSIIAFWILVSHVVLYIVLIERRISLESPNHPVINDLFETGNDSLDISNGSQVNHRCWHVVDILQRRDYKASATEAI